jgi:hypothetical protein
LAAKFNPRRRRPNPAFLRGGASGCLAIRLAADVKSRPGFPGSAGAGGFSPFWRRFMLIHTYLSEMPG